MVNRSPGNRLRKEKASVYLTPVTCFLFLFWEAQLKMDIANLVVSQGAEELNPDDERARNHIHEKHFVKCGAWQRRL